MAKSQWNHRTQTWKKDNLKLSSNLGCCLGLSGAVPCKMIGAIVVERTAGDYEEKQIIGKVDVDSNLKVAQSFRNLSISYTSIASKRWKRS